MKLILCLDERNGMAFNHRRQSRDRVLIEDLCRHIGASTLCISPYSLPLFEGHPIKTAVSEQPMQEAQAEDYCFLELQAPTLDESVSELILYRWNRHYPSDVAFRADLHAFSLTSTLDFVGSSHEKITKEVWKK